VILETDSETVTATETEYALGSLAPGQSRPFAFDLDVTDSADPGPRQFDLRVRYRNEDGDRRTSDPLEARATIDDRRDTFNVSLAATDLALHPGGTTTLAVTVHNEADERLRDIELKAYPNDPLSSGDDQAYIDALGVGERTEVTVALQAASDATTKPYPLSMDLQYVDASGDTELSESYTVGVPVTSAPDTGGGPGPLVLVAVAVVVLGGGYLLWRRR
jgi:hypothetical protein